MSELKISENLITENAKSNARVINKQQHNAGNIRNTLLYTYRFKCFDRSSEDEIRKPLIVKNINTPRKLAI
jgi:hypothetical protein